jgi:SAM-dependent methyltransferase
MANVEQARYWSGEAGSHWVDQEASYEAMLAPFTDAIVTALAPAAGERVLDVGAGTGSLTLAVAPLVQPGGSVTALDVSPRMLGRAAERIAEHHLRESVVEVLADAQTHHLALAYFDAACSRFGVMFFDDPVAAFANVGGAVRAGGRLVFTCWQPEAANEFAALPNEVIDRHLGPAPAAGRGTPGAFSLGDPDVVREVLGDAGWLHTSLTPLVGTNRTGGARSVDEAVSFTLGRGHLAGRLATATDRQLAEIRADLADEYARRHDGTGVPLGYAAWLVTASRSA